MVWWGWDGTDYELFLNDGTNTIQLTNNSYQENNFQINASGQVVWWGNDATDSEIFLATPVSDSDGDGIPDDLDVCPNEDARGFDVNTDGCIDNPSGLGSIIGTLVQEGVISPELQTSLLAKVENAEKSATKDNICAAVNQFGALKNQMNAQRGNKISDEAADEIIAYTDSVTLYLVSQLPAGQSC